MAFDPIEIDLQDLIERAASRPLVQFRQAEVFNCLLAALNSQTQELQEAAESVILDRSPLDAIGEQLNALGRIVGQDRIVFDYSLIEYFAPDTLGQSIDAAPVWVETAPISENLIVDDTWYRQLIEAKIFRNFAKFGSINENKEVANLALGIHINFVLTGPMQVSIILPYNTPTYAINFLTSFITTSSADRISFMPYPQTLEITSVILIPEQPFAPDTINAADIGAAALGWTY